MGQQDETLATGFEFTDGLLQKLKLSSWWTIMKGLPFDGGPSSTRWVFLAGFAVVAFCLVMMVAAVCYVVVKFHEVSVVIALIGLIGTTIAVVVGFSTKSQNLRHTLNAQANAGQSDKITASAPNPMSTQVEQLSPDATKEPS